MDLQADDAPVDPDGENSDEHEGEVDDHSIVWLCGDCE